MLASFLVGVFLVGLCQANKQENDLKAVTNGSNIFGTHLYDVIRTSNKDNLIFSPISVSTVMAMCQNGARGETASEIKSVLKFPETEQLNRGYESLLKELRTDGSITIEMANKLFPRTGFELNHNFTDALKTHYHAEPLQLDFGEKSEEAAQAINKFAENATRNRIKELVTSKDFSKETALVLVNAIYFKGKWKTQFSKKKTAKKEFFTNQTNSVKVDMMKLPHTKMLYGKIKELDAQVVSLPYKGERISMLILLPNSKNGLANMEKRMKTLPLEKLQEKLKKNEVELNLPKFKIESKVDLKEPLEKMGLSSIFNPEKANFSGIPNNLEAKLYISKVVQKAFIEVNEEGSTAAAATAAAFAARALKLNKPKKLIVNVNHPFTVLIVANKKGKLPLSVLFRAAILRPS